MLMPKCVFLLILQLQASYEMIYQILEWWYTRKPLNSAILGRAERGAMVPVMSTTAKGGSTV